MAWSAMRCGVLACGMVLAGSAAAGEAFVDLDGDGFAVSQGDCCDSEADGCTPPAAVNPAALEVPGNGIDDDCDGVTDPVASPACDGALAINSANAVDGAAALEVCKVSTGIADWGLVSAQYTRANGTVAVLGNHTGLQANYGSNVTPEAGDRMLALSSGFARTPGQSSYCGPSCGTLGAGTPPPGFPADSPGCPTSTGINDDAALQLVLRAPSNAVGFQISYAFYSHDWNAYVCTAFNDQMLVLMAPAPLGSINGNIAFDAQARPVSANSSIIVACDPSLIAQYAAFCNAGCPSAPDPYCPLGTALLAGTGYEAAGASAWQVASAPVAALQEFQLRLVIYDAGDGSIDSTALFDDFSWQLIAAQTVDLFRDGFEETP